MEEAEAFQASQLHVSPSRRGDRSCIESRRMESR